MKIVFLAALGVGGATVFGGIIGLFFKKISDRCSTVILGFAAGVMLASSMVGLIMPAIDMDVKYAVMTTVLGMLIGAICMDAAELLLPEACGGFADKSENDRGRYLFILAIAIHNLPEGIAAGVGFGRGDVTAGLMIAIGIAIQNIPEGMIVMLTMRCAGASVGKSFLIAAFTGAIEILGTVMGYFIVEYIIGILCFALSFAGGMMMWVINRQMIPETHNGRYKIYATYSFLIGFCIMLVINHLL